MNTNRKTDVRGTNYRRSFWFGIALCLGSLIARTPVLWITGIVFLLYGLANRSKWPQGDIDTTNNKATSVGEDKP